MDKLSPYFPSGTVSFCQRFVPVRWSLVSDFLKTREALHDYAKFRYSLMDTYASLTMSIASENEVRMGWHCRDELKILESYNVAANVRSSSLMKYDVDLHQLLGKVEGFSVLTGEVGNNVNAYRSHLRKMFRLHQFFAFRKGLAKLEFIKWDSDFDEVLRRLKSEKGWSDRSDYTLKRTLAQHFSLLRKLNDDRGMIGLASVSKRLEGDKLLEAINSEYSKEVHDLIKDFKLEMSKFFSDHMEAKMLQRKCFERAKSSRTVMLPKECHFTSPKISPLIDRCRALFHRSWALEKVLELKGRWEGRIGGLRAGFIFAVIPVAYIGGYWHAEALNVRK